jgi:hypothetical protein
MRGGQSKEQHAPMLAVAPPEVPLPFHLSEVVRALEDSGQEAKVCRRVGLSIADKERQAIEPAMKLQTTREISR